MSTTVDPYKIYLQAAAFSRTTVLIGSTNPTAQQSMGMPLIVNKAFAIELYLKCLLLIERGKLQHGHSLRALFDMLSPAIQQEIKDIYRALLDANPQIEANATIGRKQLERRMTLDGLSPLISYNGVEFDIVLDEAKNAFQQFRYIFEPACRNVSNIGLSILHNSIQDVIYRIHPEWIEETNSKTETTYILSPNAEYKEAIKKLSSKTMYGELPILCSGCGTTYLLVFTLRSEGKLLSVSHKNDIQIFPWPKDDLFTCSKCSMRTDVFLMRECIEEQATNKIIQVL